MTTDALIATLAADAPAGPVLPTRLARILLPGIAMAGLAMLGLVALTLGLREGLADLLASPVLGKTLLPFLVAALALAAALCRSRPLVRGTAAIRVLAWLLVALVMTIFTAALALTPPAEWAIAAIGPSIPICLLVIPLLSLLPLAVLVAALRQGASLHPRRSGLLAGLAAGGLAATAYSLHCPEDSPLFFILWYGMGVVVAGGIGRILGPLTLRW